MPTVDSRVVEMKFDNAEFEKNAQTSMNTLKNLDKNLQMSNGITGLKNVAKAAGNVSFEAFTTGIESCREKFSVLEVMAISAISNITNSLVDAGKKVANALFIEPITSGMQEYETKMDYVQTTMINSGKSVEEVNKVLDDLNLYADKTIFKFTDMTSALSKFTMAGLTDLDEVSNMIKGIGNIAGESGLKTEQASSAFYMISQAMSSGAMKLYQYRTLETTGFASSKFKQNLLDTAVAMGKIREAAEGMYEVDYTTDKGEVRTESFDIGTLRNSLDRGWFDKELMGAIFSRYASAEASIAMGFEDISEDAYHAAQDIKTFSQMWDTLKEAAQSGWTQSWELIIGDYEEAKKLWTGVNNVISGVLDKQSEERNELLKQWRIYSGRKHLIEGLQIAYEKLSKALGVVSEAFRKSFPKVTGKQLASISNEIKKMFERMKLGTTESLFPLRFVFENVFSTIKTVLQSAKKIISAVGEAFREMFPKSEISVFELVRKNLSSIKDFFANLRDNLTISEKGLDKVKTVTKGLLSVVDIGLQLVKALFPYIQKLAEKLFPSLKDGVENTATGFADWLINLDETIKKNDTFAKAFQKVSDVFTNLKDSIKTAVEWLKDKFAPAWEAAKNGFSKTYKEDDSEFSLFNTLGKIIKSVASFIWEFVKTVMPIVEKVWDFITDVFTGIMDIIGKFVGSIASQDMDGAIAGIMSGFGGLLAMKTGWEITDGIGDIFGAIKTLADGFKSLTDVIGGLEELKDALNFERRAAALKEFAEAIAILAVSFILLSYADVDKLGQAVGIMAGAIGSLLGVMVTLQSLTEDNANVQGGFFSNLLGQGKQTAQMLSLTKALKQFAIAIAILSVSLLIISKIDPPKLIAAGIAITVLMGEMVGVARLLAGTDASKSAKPMIAMALAIVILSSAVKKFGEMDTGELIKGMVAVVAIMIAILGFAKLLGKDASKNLSRVSGALIAIAISMVIFGAAMKIFASMDWMEIVKGLASIGGILLEMAIFSKLVSPVKLAATAAALLLVSVSMVIMGAAMKIFGSMSWEDIGKGLLSIAAVLLIFGAAAALLTPVIPAMLGLAVAVGLLGAGILLLGMGTVALAAGLAALAISGVAGIGALVIVFTELMGLIPIFFEMLALGLVAFVKGIAQSASGLVSSIAIIIKAIIDAVIKAGDKIVELFITIVGWICTALVETVPLLIETGMTLLLAFLHGIADNIQDIVATALEIIANFLLGIAEGLPLVIDAGIKLVISFINGMADGIRNNAEPMRDAMINLAKSLLEAFVTFFGPIVEKIKELLTKCKDKIKEKVSEWKEAAKNLVEGLIQGIKDKIEDAVEAVKEFGNKILGGFKKVLGIESPSKEFAECGRFCDLGMVKGLKASANLVENAAKDVGEGAIDGLKDTMSKVSTVLEDSDMQPVIKPRLDLSNVTMGAKRIGGLFNSQSIGVSGTNQNGGIIGGTGTVVFNQYNNSPKALSRIDIYRATSNQLALARVKGALT